MSANCITLTPKILTVDELTIGNWTRRLAVQNPDVDGGNVRTVGDLVLDHTNDGIVGADEAEIP